MRPGREGTIGAGIYFAETAEACAKKSLSLGLVAAEYALVKARVNLGRCRVVEHGELEWRMVTEGGFRKSDLQEHGFSSVATNFHGGWEYCVFDSEQVTVLDVSFHKTEGALGVMCQKIFRSDDSLSHPSNASDVAQKGVAETRIRSSANGEWETYKPDMKTIVVIGPGAGLRKISHVYDHLKTAGFDIVPIYANDFDRTPPGTPVLAPFGVDCIRMPDLKYNNTKNLATLAASVIVPKILSLIEEGRGPIAVMAASRGGTITVPALWEFWQGPTLVGNAGFLGTADIPAHVKCVLLTSGFDSFTSRRPETTKSMLRKENPAAPVLVYHDPQDNHEFRRLQGTVVEKLLEVASADSIFVPTDGPWAKRCRLHKF
jgi:hypothetical protein